MRRRRLEEQGTILYHNAQLRFAETGPDVPTRNCVKCEDLVVVQGGSWRNGVYSAYDLAKIGQQCRDASSSLLPDFPAGGQSPSQVCPTLHRALNPVGSSRTVSLFR